MSRVGIARALAATLVLLSPASVALALDVGADVGGASADASVGSDGVSAGADVGGVGADASVGASGADASVGAAGGGASASTGSAGGAEASASGPSGSAGASGSVGGGGAEASADAGAAGSSAAGVGGSASAGPGAEASVGGSAETGGGGSAVARGRAGAAPAALPPTSRVAASSARMDLPWLLRPGTGGGSGPERLTRAAVRESARLPLADSRRGVPGETVEACRSAVAQAAAPYGAVQVSASSAGEIERTTHGWSAPVAVRIVYAHQHGYETKEATVGCVASQDGRIVGLV